MPASCGSEVANGRINSIDTTATTANMPGVPMILTDDDFTSMGGNPASWLLNSRNGEPMGEPKRPVLAHGQVRHVGILGVRVGLFDATTVRVNAVIDALQRADHTHVTHIDMPVSSQREWAAMNKA